MDAPMLGSFSNVLDRVRALLPNVQEAADESEQAGRITSRTLLALRDAGTFRMCVPRSLDGGELPPAMVLDVVETLATVDASTAWSAMIGATTAVVSGYLSEDTAKEIYGPSTTVTVGPFAPLGRARRDGDGYRLSGRWPYVSMCRDASWIVGGGLDDNSRRTLFLFPARNAHIHETWQVMGLRGTGSHDIEVREEFIPAARAVPFGFEQPVNDAPLYRFPVLGLLAAAISSTAIGAARGAVNDLIELAGAKTPTYAIRRLQERPLVQLQVGQAEAELRAARAFLREAVAEAWDQAQDGTVGVTQRATLRLAAAQATATSARVVDLMYAAGGGTSNYLHSPLQRRFRDVHAATQHVMVSSATIELAGRVLLGMRVDPDQL
ncbi:acyl-CoA dehydrogenase family protein [Krasilnikovia sp. M28-CT-15]|uniref:acyl-CoA dehydrogenase family protein n=1 Tax=Krasilnikovia sp. M28-CT-15 TaxID=3373540 RepID=UPI00399D475C